jgi:hypothetical protein
MECKEVCFKMVFSEIIATQKVTNRSALDLFTYTFLEYSYILKSVKLSIAFLLYLDRTYNIILNQLQFVIGNIQTDI